MTTKTELKEFATWAFNHGMYYRQLYHCKAYMMDYDNYIILKSYNTIVAIYDKKVGTVYALDNYSTTTSQHIRKFCSYVSAARLTKLYKDSTKCIEEALEPGINTYILNNKAWNDIENRDFIGYIRTIKD